MSECKEVRLSEKPAVLSRLMSSLLLLLLFFSLCASGFAQGADRARDIVIRVQELQQQLHACGSDMSCITPIQQQIEALAKQYSELYSELTSPSGQQPVSAATEECPPSDPCCRVEKAKQWARNTYGVEPSWVEARPAEIKMVWDFHEADENNDIRFVLTYEFTGCLLLVYDQQKKGVLEGFDLYGPSTSSVGSFHLDSISAQLAAVDRITQNRLTVHSGNPNDFVIHHSADMQQPKPEFQFKYTPSGGLDGRLGAYGPRPKDSLFPENLSWLGMNGASYRYSPLNPEQCISLKEIQQALEAGILVKQISLRDMSDMTVRSIRLWHLEEGAVTNTVSLKPLEPGIMALTPGDGFKSNRPDPKQPFAPLSKTYTLKNNGEKPITYSIEKKANWLNIDKTGGTLPPKGTAEIAVSINVPVAGKLPEDTYYDTILFTNATDGKGSTTRPAEVSLGEEQTWRVMVTGWLRDTIKWDGLVFTDENGKKSKILQAVKFNWDLTGEFVIKKDRGKWVYKDGKVTAAKLQPFEDFQPKGIYSCSVWLCKAGKVPIGLLVGKPIVGFVVGNRVQLRWWPFNPAACVSCQPKHPHLPQTPFEGFFESGEFIDQISSESYSLQNKTFPPVEKEGLYYTVTLKRIK